MAKTNLLTADGGFEQLDQPPSLGQCLLLQMALQLADQRHDERPSLPIDRIWRPGDVDHADDAPVERIAAAVVERWRLHGPVPLAGCAG